MEINRRPHEAIVVDLASVSCWESIDAWSDMSERIASDQGLTSRLFSASPPLFEAATQTPFLIAAGNGTLSREKLSSWLSQDRLYGQAYISFIGSLIAHVQLPTKHVATIDHDSSTHWRIARTLHGCLDNIFRELKFFEDTAQKYGLDLEATDTQDFTAVGATTDYIGLFQRFSCPVKPDGQTKSSELVLLTGLVVLWAMEKCYLEAWRFAARHSDYAKDPTSDADGGALRNALISNWTSQEFVDFVQQLEGLVDEEFHQLPVSLREDAQTQSEKLWQEVLDIERRFWPDL